MVIGTEFALTRRHLSLAGARAALDAAEAKARQMEITCAIALVDCDGIVKASIAMDGAMPLAVRMAQRKAASAACSGLATGEWWDVIKDDGSLLHGIPQQDDLVIFAGGLPLLWDGAVFGAIGVSGGHYSEDHVIASAGAQVLAGP